MDVQIVQKNCTVSIICGFYDVKMNKNKKFVRRKKENADSLIRKKTIVTTFINLRNVVTLLCYHLLILYSLSCVLRKNVSNKLGWQSIANLGLLALD